MFEYHVTLTGVSQLMFGGHVPEPKRSDETHEQREERLWQEKVHLTKSGQCFLAPFALKNALESASQWIGKKIAGEGQKTFVKRFRCGVMCTDPLLLTDMDGTPLTIEQVEPIRLFVPSDGKRGSGKRVYRIFPTLDEWTAHGSILILDNKITDEILREHIVAAGKFVGFGSMRVENGGINGRFTVDAFSKSTVDEMTPEAVEA